MNKIYLQLEEINTIVEFMNTFDAKTIEISCDNSSGIGGILIAKINSIVIKDIEVNIERIISGEKDW